MDKAKVMKILRAVGKTYPYKDLGICISHPIIGSTAIIMDKEFVRVTEENWTEVLEWGFRNLEQQDSIMGILMLINKPYRLTVLRYVSQCLTEQEFNEALHDSWTSVEFPHQEGVPTLLGLFRQADKKLLMSQEELDFLAKLPEEITVFRGYSPEMVRKKMTVKHGLSYTLSRHKASWFACRFATGGVGRIVTAKVAKDKVFAYFSDRGEEEIVVDPKFLKDWHEEKVYKKVMHQ